MSNFIIRDAVEKDYGDIVKIYNSNKDFLIHHLGVEHVDEAFIKREIATMKAVGFRSSVIVNQEDLSVQGVLDYKPEREVYLSLIMLASNLQGKGIGTDIYFQFETDMIKDGATSLRIDVVNDYQDNLVSFWSKRGFRQAENIVLEWGNKKSNAVVMRSCHMGQV